MLMVGACPADRLVGGRTGMGHNNIAGEIHTVIAFRHVGPFPERPRGRRQDNEVLLCIDCLDDWLPAGVDPYFADHVIAEGLIYLDDTGNVSKEPTDRYVESMMRDELTPGHPQRCTGCNMRWDELSGDRIVYRPTPAST